jgi:hypothetical protein
MPPFGPIYALAEKEQQELRKYFETNLQRGLIRYSRSPAGALILFVPKKNGKLRLCVDYKKLNQIIKKNRNALPFISEILNKLGSAKIFIKLDLKNAYHRLRIKKGNEWKTAFRTKYNYFEYLVILFGFINASAIFQAYINHALAGLINIICVIYFDNILIYSQNRKSHIQAVCEILAKLRA